MEGINMPSISSSRMPPNQIRWYRRKKNLRIKDVVELMELSSPSQIAHWEKGHKQPCLINALKLAYITGSTVEILFKPQFDAIRHEIFLKKQSGNHPDKQLTLLQWIITNQSHLYPDQPPTPWRGKLPGRLTTRPGCHYIAKIAQLMIVQLFIALIASLCRRPWVR